jgi:hypothetical protein
MSLSYVGKWLEGQKHGRGEYIHVALSQLPPAQSTSSYSAAQKPSSLPQDLESKNSSIEKGMQLTAVEEKDATSQLSENDTFEPAEEPTAGSGATEAATESSSEADDQPADLPQSGGSNRSNKPAAAANEKAGVRPNKASAASLPVEASQQQGVQLKKRVNPQAVAKSKAAQAHMLAAQSAEVEVLYLIDTILFPYHQPVAVTTVAV